MFKAVYLHIHNMSARPYSLVHSCLAKASLLSVVSLGRFAGNRKRGFSKTPVSRLRVDGRKRGFWRTMT